VSIPPDDVDYLISYLAHPLPPDAARAFRDAAAAALSELRCPGPGTIYRTLAPLQRAYFDPPSDGRAGWDIGHELRTNKLTAAPALAYGGDQRKVRYRPQFKAMD
jgi:hypothetical protein